MGRVLTLKKITILFLLPPDKSLALTCHNFSGVFPQTKSLNINLATDPVFHIKISSLSLLKPGLIARVCQIRISSTLQIELRSFAVCSESSANLPIVFNQLKFFSSLVLGCFVWLCSILFKGW